MLSKEELVFKGRVFTLIKKTKILPNQHIAKLEIVKHPGAVLIIPFLTAKKVILLKQFRPVINSYLLELPAGTKEKSETFLQCAKREIIEETNYTAGKFTNLGFIYPVPGYSTEKIFIFKATNLKPVKNSKKDPDEVISLQIVSKNEIKKLIKTKKLVDAKTICALTICGWL